MAIIKCPECGHQISDKAPVCPSCGVEIAGKIIRCQQCGEVYFSDQEMCPNCHHVTPSALERQGAAMPPQVSHATASVNPPTQNVGGAAHPGTGEPPVAGTEGKQPGKKGYGVLILSFVLALVVLSVCFFLYNKAKTDKEREAYEYAMNSSDPLVLQSYLDTYTDADQAHRDSIQAHLTQLKQADLDWTNAVASDSQTALEDYLAKHPDSPHRTEVQHMIDSLDWVLAANENTLEAYKLYLVDHANGEHVDDANDAIKMLNAQTVQPEEKSAVASIFRRFFQSINSKDEEALTATVAPIMTSFLGKSDATKNDVATFLHKIYKEDITNMNWHLNNDYKIDKKEVGDNEYEYAVQFSALQDIERTDPTKEKSAKYRVSAKVGPDGKISAFNLTKILE